MVYAIIGMFIVIFVLVTFRIRQKYTIRSAIAQMEEIEQHPEKNNQLKALSSDRDLEHLFTRINLIYKARQQERIVYQRRETQIRREIENISHDLRTPLTSIIGYIDLIRSSDNQAEKDEYMDIIQQRAKVLQGFIQDFYELSRIETDDYPLLFDTISVQNALSEAAVAYYNEFEKREISVQLEMDEKHCYIVADQIQLNRIFNNLIQNALKYAANSFRIKQYCDHKECVIRFMNEKGNMTEKELSFIFERFYTGDISRNNNSTGLGLTITKILTEKMKGRIDARLEGEWFVIELRFPSI
ncbi:HAMP domain-containing histidine kinase [Lachnospiraceae bacterium MD1]|uniref:histidine kinase n=1 Tax=Variimorphobacter saccharofermentans TaxID=2755051 RepID=A0A839K2Y1_9FIRM|nr:HAMP domain-containing sensor histidine kinase [Variimorphobacter saccharofermentans]MBB2183738.1 HAMP domain-containing histidine kinase [Variimorphobacter saccharofermentans]